MTKGMRLKEIREGLAKLLVMDISGNKGPGKYTGLPFFNPSMEKNRNMTVLFLKAVRFSGKTVLDGLSATGALGVRVALEIPGIRVTCNDRNPMAVDLMRKNVENNHVEIEGIHQESLQAHLSNNHYDFIDVDPFGSPVPYMDAALQSARREGFLGFTATDTAVLCGAQQKACLRRYNAKPLNVDCCKEIALRLLIGSIVRTGAKFDKAVQPVFSFGTDHYFRVFIQVHQGANKADLALSRIGYVHFDRVSGNRWVSTERQSGCDWAGPLWIGSLLDREVVSRLAPLRYMSHTTSVLTDLLKLEIDAPPLYVNTHFLAKLLRTSPPPFESFMEKIRDQGHVAVRTHFDVDGLKTDVPWNDLLELYGGSPG